MHTLAEIARALNRPVIYLSGLQKRFALPVMERQSVTTDADSKIVNDANLWATETMQNAKYPLELFLRVITVSLETMKLVNALPPLGLLS